MREREHSSDGTVGSRLSPIRRRERLSAVGIDAGEIVDGRPGPAVEMRDEDPDGFALMIAQKTDEERES
jgi:hypothetical protein